MDDLPELRDRSPGRERFLADVLAGLSRSPRSLPCKYFYDERGSALFERICDLDEYYPTRTELEILRRHLADIAARIGPRARVVEPGCGAGVKTRLLLEALECPSEYVPIDISRDALVQCVAELSREFDELAFAPICADFTAALELPVAPAEARTTVVFYPGSTIGNFEPVAASRFLRRMGEVVGPDGAVLIGVDLAKDPGVLVAAYDDAAGVTAEFNRNLLVRIGRELDGDFDPDAFEHRAVYEREPSRIVMQLVAHSDQVVTVAGRRFAFAAGEAITTEYSHKPSLADFERIAAAAGLRVDAVWTDPRGWFSVQLLRPGAPQRS